MKIGTPRIFKAAGPASIPETTSYGQGIYGERYSPESRREFVQAARDRVWVGRCCTLIAKSFTQVEVKAKRGDETIDDHELLTLLKQPNARDPALQFFEWSVWWSQCLGEWYWEIVPNRGGGIFELYPLRGHLVNIKPGQGGQIGGYTYDPNETGQIVQFDPAVAPVTKSQSVIAGRFANPFDDYYGMPPLRGAKDDIVSEYYAVRYDHRFFRNSARPDIVLSFKDKLDPRQRDANREEWTAFKGVDNSHRAAVLDGDAHVETVSQSPRDVEYLEGRRLAREGECAAFGVPPVLVGDMTRATYSNFREAEPIFWRATMLPLLEFFASWANAVLVPFYEDIDEIEFDTSGIAALQDTEGERISRLAEAVAKGLITPNEGRLELGRDEIDGCDNLYLPMTMTPYASAVEITTGAPPPMPIPLAPPAPIPDPNVSPNGKPVEGQAPADVIGAGPSN